MNTAPADVDRFTSGGDDQPPGDEVVAELRGLAELHQAQLAARKAA